MAYVYMLKGAKGRYYIGCTEDVVHLDDGAFAEGSNACDKIVTL